MTSTNVIQLVGVRDLLGQVEQLRKAVIAGKVQGWTATVMDDLGKESIYLAGVYKDDPEQALKAALKQSAARVMREDAQPRLHVT